jgi:glycosyltransferase involved in cell wall biosynthesis
LKIAGDGPEYGALRKLAEPNIEFCGTVSEVELRDLYAKCRALIMPGEEDFGLTPVEAMASGKPVIALGRGGVLESVPAKSPRAGFFYDIPGAVPLEQAIREFETCEGDVSPLRLQAVAARFNESRFAAEMTELIAADQPETLGETPGTRTVGRPGASTR